MFECYIYLTSTACIVYSLFLSAICLGGVKGGVFVCNVNTEFLMCIYLSVGTDRVQIAPFY